jgi:hypothetical protein
MDREKEDVARHKKMANGKVALSRREVPPSSDLLRKACPRKANHASDDLCLSSIRNEVRAVRLDPDVGDFPNTQPLAFYQREHQ